MSATTKRPVSKLTRVTPKMAREFLKHNTMNRPISRAQVEFLKEEIRSGQYKVNGDAIRFNCDGTLIDGQHKCTAIAEGETAVDIFVTRGLDKDAFDTLDVGKKRSASDTLAVLGRENTLALGSAVKVIIQLAENRYQGRGNGGRKISNREVREFEGKNPGLKRSVKLICHLYGTGSLPAVGYVAALHYLMSRKAGQQAADAFWTAVAIGEKQVKGMPTFTLARMIRSRKGQQADSRRVVVLSIKSWNAYRAKQKPERFTYRHGEDMPEISG